MLLNPFINGKKKKKKKKLVELANRVSPDEVAHNDLLYLDIYSLPSSILNSILSMILLGRNLFFYFCRCKFCRLQFGALRTRCLMFSYFHEILCRFNKK